jgi:hypothetical protein
MDGGLNNGYGYPDLRWPNDDPVVGPQMAHPHSTNATGSTFFVNTYFASGNQICLWEYTGDRAPGGSNPPVLARAAIGLSNTYNWLGESVGQPDVPDNLDGFNCQVLNAVFALDRVWATFGTDVFNNGSAGGIISTRLNTNTAAKEWEHLFWGGLDYYYFFPAITVLGAQSSDPNVGLTFSAAHPEYHYASLATFIYNQGGTDPFIRTADGLASYVDRDSSGKNRWGDYNAAVYDWTCGHLWVAGGYAGTGNTWRTRIAAYDFGGEGVCDRVEVTSPNGGEFLAIGSHHLISWEASNPDPSSSFYLMYKPEDIWVQVAGPLPSTARSYYWEVPGPTTTTGRIFVGSWNGTSYDSYDYGDTDFMVYQPACNPDFTLSCPTDLNQWSNDGMGSTDSVDFYSCNGVPYDGPEYAYEFSTPTTSEVTVVLSGLEADLDLLILEGSTCYPTDCIADSIWSGTADETVTFTAVGGVDYRIVVDGYEGATSPYTIELWCDDETVFKDGFESGDTTMWSATIG